MIFCHSWKCQLKIETRIISRESQWQPLDLELVTDTSLEIIGSTTFDIESRLEIQKCWTLV